MFCSRNAIRNVTCDAAVFIVNCHVSENPNTGPSISHSAVKASVAVNVHGEPTTDAVPSAIRLNPFVMSPPNAGRTISGQRDDRSLDQPSSRPRGEARHPCMMAEARGQNTLTFPIR